MSNDLDSLSPAELKERIKKLSRLNAIKSDLISISAHRLRTSLSALKWIVRMLIDKDLGELNAEQESFLKKAYDSNEQMIVLINDLLSLNHNEDLELRFEYLSTDLIELIDDLLFEFSGEAHKKGIQIVFLKPEEPLGEIKLDRDKIGVVLQNLIENAIKYSNDGDKVFISIQRNRKNVQIAVKDTGIGIELQDQLKIFHKFYRAPNAQAKEKIGSGLGLVTTKTIVERHGGKIWFESAPKTGSTFYFTIPLDPPPQDGSAIH